MTPDLDPDDPSQAKHIEDEYTADLQNLFDNLAKELEKFITGSAKAHTQAVPAERMPFNITGFLKHLNLSIEEQVLNPGRVITSSYATASYKHGVLFAKIQMNMEAVLRKGDWDPKILEILKARDYTELQGISDEVSKRISRAVTDGMLQGENPRVIARQIREVTDLGKTRSETLARTEVMKAVNQGARDRSGKQGYTILERIEADDERTCTDWEFVVDDDGDYPGGTYHGCSEINGVVFTMGQAAQIDAQTHPNCRGSWIPRMTDEEAAAMDQEG